MYLDEHVIFLESIHALYCICLIVLCMHIMCFDLIYLHSLPSNFSPIPFVTFCFQTSCAFFFNSLKSVSLFSSTHMFMGGWGASNGEWVTLQGLYPWSALPAVVVWMRCLPKSQAFNYLVPNWWCCLGMRGKCVLVGGSVSLDRGFEVSELCTIPSVLFLFCAFGWRCKLSASFFCKHAFILLSWTPLEP